MLAHIRRVFGLPQSSAPKWPRLNLPSEKEASHAVVSTSGLSGNGTVGLRETMEFLHRHFDGEFSVSLSNLGGHTGHYTDLNRSGIIRWVKDAWSEFWALAPISGERRVVLVGHSTATLVNVAIYVVWRLLRLLGFKKACALRIDGLVAWAPAFGLRSRADKLKLQLALLCRLILVPSALLVLVICLDTMYLPLLLSLVLVIWDLLNHVTISNEAAENSEAVVGYDTTSFSDRFSAISFFVISAIPWIAAATYGLSPSHAKAWVFTSTSLVVIVSWVVIQQVVQFGHWQAEEESSVRYRRLPINTASSLIIFQWLVSPLLYFIDCPVLFLLSGKDELVDNELTTKLARHRQLRSCSFELKQAKHFVLSREEQAQFGYAVCFWLSNELGWSKK